MKKRINNLAASLIVPFFFHCIYSAEVGSFNILKHRQPALEILIFLVLAFVYYLIISFEPPNNNNQIGNRK